VPIMKGPNKEKTANKQLKGLKTNENFWRK